MAKLPALQFYTGDWMKDPGVRTCSYSAKGLWMDMLCIMSEATPRGFLQVNGAPLSPAILARMSGGAVDEVICLLNELELAGVYSRDRHGVIYSRRIVRDEKQRVESKKFGSRGGNPDLVKNYHYKGFVYLMGRPGGDTKIGASVNPVKRCQKIRESEGESSITLLAKMAVEDMGKEENEMHVKYAQYKTCGEWFKLPKAELDSLIIRFSTSSPPPSRTPYPPQKMKGKMKISSNGEGPGGEHDDPPRIPKDFAEWTRLTEAKNA